MRLRNTMVAALGALVLVVTLPTSAGAATGEFSYKYTGLNGQAQEARLSDPPGRECITLPEVADPDASNPAHSPRNDTDATATVFTDVDCDGDYYTLRPNGGSASERLKLRSVVFS
ncbi:hypothetical protein ACFZBU_13670 [Embleya sp. NPDC008237]|uniref:hypothetical protein n=1 Tax=Embleya sp. NPDC008237 TaxID=3363978 RepID=UPI0036E8CFAA